MRQVLGHAQPEQAARVVEPAAAEPMQDVDFIWHVKRQAAHPGQRYVLQTNVRLFRQLDSHVAQRTNEHGHARELGENCIEARGAECPLHVGNPDVVNRQIELGKIDTHAICVHVLRSLQQAFGELLELERT